MAVLLSLEVARAAADHGSNGDEPLCCVGAVKVTTTGLAPHVSATKVASLVPGPFAH